MILDDVSEGEKKGVWISNTHSLTHSHPQERTYGLAPPLLCCVVWCSCFVLDYFLVLFFFLGMLLLGAYPYPCSRGTQDPPTLQLG